MAYQCLNLDYLALMSGGDEADRRRLLEMLEKDLQQYPQKMQQTLKSADWDKLERQAHYFKSTLPFTGCKALIEAHQAVYYLSKRGGKRAELAALLSQVQKYCQAVLQEVQMELKKG